MDFPEVLFSTPVCKIEHMHKDFGLISSMNMSSYQSMGSVTPSDSLNEYTSSPATVELGCYMMAPTNNPDSSLHWPCNDSLVSLYPQLESLPSHRLESLDSERYSECSIGRHYLQSAAPLSPSRLRADLQNVAHETRCKSPKLQRAQIGAPRKIFKDGDGVEVVHRAMRKCDYPGCYKGFHRNEHLKRHKQTIHAEGSIRFSCEFCGKDRFTRKDNLNSHRKLHIRPNTCNRGVDFIPAAVPIIKQEEERSRKHRAPLRSLTMPRDT